VNVCEPDKPVPDTFIVSVPLFTLAAVVAVVAFPDKDAVIVPAEKLPEASRATMADAVFALVAVVAELETLPAVEIVLSLVSAIEPANMVLVTVPESPVVIAVPVVAGSVKTVPVPAIAAGIT
jgi:hypothetical protein